MISNQIILQIKSVLKDLDLPTTNVVLEHPAIEEHGDYSTNIALTTKVPAQTIVDELQKNQALKKIVAKITVASPGFINFHLTPKALLKELNQIITKKDRYGSADSGKGKTVVIDYSAPNIAKRFTIGHLRSTIIGQAVYNLYRFLGWKTIGDNHLGDWGTQFGKMIIALKKWAKKPIDQLSIDEMETLYVKFHREAKKDESLEDQARLAFKNLENGHKIEKELWLQLVARSMEEFEQLYRILNIKIDTAYGESHYQNLMPSVIHDAREKNLAQKSQGALVVSFPQDQLPPAMLLKSDRTTTYFTRDLATIKFRQEKWHPDLIIYEVGAEQTLYFRQVFWTAELLGLAHRSQLVHIPHGLIRLKEGKMSTRQGNVIKLEAVLDEAVKRAAKFNQDKKVANAVGIGAVKYNDLKHAPSTGYTFNWDEILSLEGNSGPYLQYTHARCRSVLAKSKITNYRLPITDYSQNPEELAVLRFIYRFPEVIKEAAENYAPNLICNFLFELAQRFNTFYNQHKILPHSPKSPQSPNSTNLRLTLAAATAQVLKNGLGLLGIATPEKM